MTEVYSARPLNSLRDLLSWTRPSIETPPPSPLPDADVSVEATLPLPSDTKRNGVSSKKRVPLSPSKGKEMDGNEENELDTNKRIEKMKEPTCIPHSVIRLTEGVMLPREDPKWQPRMMVAHDLKGGYLTCDKWEGGPITSDQPPFVFTHWGHIDIFCYFSHQFVTIPPSSYIKTGHLHGCKVLGTLLTEWNEGQNMWTSILRDDRIREEVIEQLVDIMMTWRFDGWLLNVENELDPHNDIPFLEKFVGDLRKSSKEAHPLSEIIWYDAITNDGKLEWQNALNDKNREFYNKSDGIFLNYSWTTTDIENSVRYSRGGSSIFAGIDVFSRQGLPGGWQTGETVGKVVRRKVSSAIFAPAWCVEQFPLEDPCMQMYKFWDLLSPSLSTRPVCGLPIRTTFRNGVSKNGKHFSMADMDLQPHLALNKGIPTEDGLLIHSIGDHLLWHTNFEAIPELRVHVRSNHPVHIILNQKKMIHGRTLDDGTMVMHSSKNDIMKIRSIFVRTLVKDTLLTFFNAHEVDTVSYN